jgi:tetratricopeptide (TPR) repeat protein
MRSILLIALLLGGVIPCAAQSATDPWAESYRLEALTQYDSAAKALEPVLKKNPQHEFAILRHGWLNYLRGAHNEAIADYQKALDINPTSLDARLGLMLPLIAQQRWREVASHAEKVLAVAPWNYYAHVRLMISEEGERKWDSLEKHALRVSQHYPSDATVLVYLARAYVWQKKDKEARRAYEQVLERVPNHIEALQYLNRP